jgi:aspartate/methionine/tyrosine aminotransferase
MLSIVIGDPGDGVMLTKPSYIAFSEDFGLVGKCVSPSCFLFSSHFIALTKGRMKPVFVPFGDEDQFSENSVACYEKTLKEAAEQGTTIKALILCNPHNPLGRCYPPSTLIAIMKFCNQHKIHLLADEIYAQSVYSVSDPQVIPFTSTLSLDWKQHIDPNYFHHVYGMSKDHACGGLRVGCLWSQNSELQRAVIAINGFHWAGQIDQRVAETILEDEAWLDSFLSTSRERLSKANFLAKRLLHEAGIPYAPGANAGFFLWIDLSEWLVVEDGDGDEGWKAEERLMKKFLSEGKVFLTPGSGQASEKPGWFRLVFSHREEVLREGIARFVGCLEKR